MKPKAINKSQNAIPFISYVNQKFVFNPEAEEFLLSIPEEKKVAAISIVGKYRTGKSFFINRVLLETKKSGFAVGPTVNPCTKGLWIWKKTLASKNPQYPDMETIVIDTEGFGGIDETNNHDSRIFLFSLLLSSFFIYNSVGSIDENALNSLNLIINLAASIQKKSGNKYDTSLYPAFLWIVRDFTLQLVDKQNNKLTPTQYLQNALQIQQGTSTGVINKNKIREQFTKVFTDRDCMTMVIPVEKDTSLQRLDQLDNAHLRPEFLNQMEDVQKRIFTKLRPKYVNNRQLNGHMFVEVIKGYIEIMNSGQLPTIENTFVYIRRSQCMKAVSESIRKLEGLIEHQLTNNGLLDQKQVVQFRNSLQNQIMTFFKEKLLSHQQPDQQAANHLKRKMQELLSEFVERNKRSWQNKYRQLSEQCIGELRDKIFREQYKDYNQFIEDFNRVKDQYELETGSNPEKWAHFNLIAESLHRLAGETIIAKITNTTKVENEILQKKIKLREDELSNKKKQHDDEKTYFKSRIQELQKHVSKTTNSQGVKEQTIRHLKEENARLKEKCLGLEELLRDKQMQIGRINTEVKKVNAIQVEQTKSELRIMKSNIEKQKTLHEMQKEYHDKQIQSYKQKVGMYEAENKRLKNNNNTLSNQNDDLKNKMEQKQQKQIEDEQLIETYKNKIENLVVQGNKKSEMVNDHNDWVLEKNYLENQVSFLKNTLHQNKRLHDALLVALQQSVNTVEGDGSSSLVETNKNLSSAMEKLEARCRLLEEKSQKLKRFKKIVKNCTALQCLHCLKWVANAVFPQHLASCANQSPEITKNLKQNPFFIDLAGFHLSINQTVIKEIEQNKPFTQYLIQVTYHHKKWVVSQKFKSFCELQQILITNFPTVKLPQSSNAIISVHTDINQLINSKKTTIAVEERRKALQQFMRDLSKIDIIRNSQPYRQFIKFDENSHGAEQDSENLPKSSQKLYSRQVASSMGIMKKQSKGVSNYTGIKTRKH